MCIIPARYRSCDETTTLNLFSKFLADGRSLFLSISSSDLPHPNSVSDTSLAVLLFPGIWDVSKKTGLIFFLLQLAVIAQRKAPEIQRKTLVLPIGVQKFAFRLVDWIKHWKHRGSRDNTVDKRPDLWSEGRCFDASRSDVRSFSFKLIFCADSYSVSVPPPSYRSGTSKTPVILPKERMADYI